jgi:hypothetical protein
MKLQLNLRRNKSLFITIVVPLFFLLMLFFFFFGHFKSSSNSPQDRAREIIAMCNNNKDADVCFADQFERLARQFRFSYTVQVLAEMQQTKQVANGCHFIAHVIAAEEVMQNGGKWEEVVAHIPADDCTGGFIMGAIEGYRHYDKTFFLNAKTAPEICRAVSGHSKIVGSDQTCAHTMGHLFLIEKSGNVSQSLDECGKMPSQYRYECYSGTFMENIFRRNLLLHGIGKELAWNEKTFGEQEQLCNSHTDIVAQACWRELSHMIIDLANKDKEKITKRCSLAPEKARQKSCQKHATDTLLLLEKPSGEEM